MRLFSTVKTPLFIGSSYYTNKTVFHTMYNKYLTIYNSVSSLICHNNVHQFS